MQITYFPTSPDHHVDTLFSAKAAQTGGVIRRNRAWANREIGRDRLIVEVKARGFHMVSCGTQYVIICSGGGLELIC